MTAPTPTGKVLAAMFRLTYRRARNRLASRFNRKKGETAARTSRRGLSVWLVLMALGMLVQGTMAFSRLLCAFGATADGKLVVRRDELSQLRGDLVDFQKELRSIGDVPARDDERRVRSRYNKLLTERLAAIRARIDGRSTPTEADREAARAYRKSLTGEDILVDHLTAFPDPPNYDFDALGLAHRARAIFAMLASAIFLMLLTRRLADDEGATETWAMEWLFHLPARSGALFLSRLASRAITDEVGWLVHTVLALPTFLAFGYEWSSLALAPVVALALNLQVAAVHLFLEVRLHRDLSHDRRRNVQALCRAVSSALFLFVLACALAPDVASWLARWTPSWPRWLPWGLLSEGIEVPAIRPLIVPTLLLGGLGLAALSILLAERAVAGGLVVESGPTRRTSRRATARTLRGIVGRELTMLARDRRLFVQAFVVPLFGIVYQVIMMGPRMRETIAAGGGAFAFGIGAWVLLQGAARITVGEGRAIWLLWTMPQRLGRPFLEKTLFWGSSGALYTVGALIFAATRGPFEPVRFAVDAAAALGGVAIMAVVVGAYAILYAEPGADQEPKPLDGKAQGTLLLVAALYGATFFAEPWPRLVFTVIAAVLAITVWQRADDELSYLLDAHARPSGQLRTSDGLLALIVFMGVQTIVAIVAVMVHLPEWLAIPIGFTIAGAIASLSAVRHLRRERVPDVAAAIAWRPAADAPPRRVTFPLALLVGGAAGALAHVYGGVVSKLAGASPPPLTGAEGLAFAALAVIAAPIVEEILFRGVLYGALRRSLPRVGAVLASALLFAVIHPMIGTPPVFLLGVLAAFARERSGRLTTAMLVHAAYNGTLVALPLLAR